MIQIIQGPSGTVAEYSLPSVRHMYRYHRSVEGLMFTYGIPVVHRTVLRRTRSISRRGLMFPPLSLLLLPLLYVLASDYLLLLKCMIVSLLCAPYCTLILDDGRRPMISCDSAPPLIIAGASFHSTPLHVNTRLLLVNVFNVSLFPT